jgi:anti-sigma regulatory factor (Ser/Thr protein kinase)
MRRVEWTSSLDSLGLIEPLLLEMPEVHAVMSAVELRLLLSEAVTNAIQHANQLQEQKKVIIEWCRGEEAPWQVEEQFRLNSWVFSIQDEGEGFEMEEVPEPCEMPGGRGVFILKSLTKFVCYRNEERRLIFII